MVYGSYGTLPMLQFKSQAFNQPYKCQPLHIITGTCESYHQQLRSSKLPQILNLLASWKDLLALPRGKVSILNYCLSIFFNFANILIPSSIVKKKEKRTECCFPMLHIEGNEDSSAFFILHKTMKMCLITRIK